jgi:PAS domain S-box-containing protein
MNWQLDVFSIIYFLATLTTTGVFIYARQHSRVKGTAYFSFLVASVMVWAFFQALEYAVGEPAGKILFAKFQYLGISTIGVTWYLFSLSYNRKENWLGQNYLLLLVIPALTILIAFTNEAHHLLWTQITPLSSAPGSNLLYAHGPVFWIIFIYNYIFLALGTLLGIQTAVKSKEIYRSQMIGLIVSALIPWVGNLIYVSGLSPIPGLDLTPLGFAVSALTTAWSIFYLRLFDLVPIAHDQLVENLADGVIVLDADNRVVEINPTARKLLKIENRATVGQPIAIFLQPWPGVIERFREMQSGRTEVYVDDQEVSDVDVRISPLLDERKTLAGRIITIRDISDQKKLERRRENITRSIVHDLRNPLTSVAISLDTLRRQTMINAPKGQIETLDASQQSIQQMLDMVDSLLDTYRLEKGELPLNRRRVSLNDLASEAVRMVLTLANKKRILVQLDIPDGLPSANVDPSLIRRVFQNLLDNSVKSTLDGRLIRIHARFDPAHGEFVISVTDSMADLQETTSLLNKFAPGKEMLSGDGLGLAFCRIAVEAHGGRIWIDDSYKNGTKISLTLPDRLM